MELDYQHHHAIFIKCREVYERQKGEEALT
jgi:hypothetical protein